MQDPPDLPGPEDERRRLLLESIRLGAEEAGRGEDESHRAFLVFTAGGERFAVDLVHVRRVLRPSAISRVPGAPPEVLGLTNSQGEVLCVLDPAKVLGLPPSPPPDPERAFVVTLHFGDREAGFLVDSADDVWEALPSDVAPVLESLEPAKAKFYEGTLARGGLFAGVLSPSACLNP
jgi:purine-binding chemotaxis protein CheW